jgi:surfeit locus 1 family protein
LLAASLLFIVLVGLGSWQLARKAEKETLIGSIAKQLVAEPGNLWPAESWKTLDAARDEFRRLKFVAEFLHAEETLVYTVGSALRPDVSGPGYWVFTPARLPAGGIVVVNRGFVPEGRKDAGSRRAGQATGPLEIVGATRWPEMGGWFTPKEEPASNLWFARNHLSMAAVKGWGPVAPFYVEQEAPAPPGGLPQVGAIRVDLPNNHLQYALTWYGLAVVLVGLFAFWLRSQLREGRQIR